MKIILPLNYIDEFHYKRFKEQFAAYASKFDKVILAVRIGVRPKNDIKNLEIVFRTEVEARKNRELSAAQKARKYVSVLTGYNLMRRIKKQRNVVKHFIDNGVDGDLVLSYSGHGLCQIFDCILAESLGIPAVYRMRGDGVKERNIYSGLSNRLIGNYYHFKSLEHYDMFIPIKEAYKQKLVNWNVPPRKITNPVGLGVDVRAFKRFEYPEELTIGFFGRISAEKNIDFMFEVMRRTPNINYIILGKNLLEVNNFPPNCKYLGYVHKDKMPLYYNMINVLINPSLSEGVANTVLEAYATKTPVIGSPETFANCLPVYGYCLNVDRESVRVWVDVIKRLDSLELKNIGDLARNYAESNSWLKFAETMANTLKQVE